nr:helix-turn-helix domain-containing protein [Actinomycetota bacterium]
MSTPNPAALHDYSSAAEYLNVSPRLVRKLVETGALPCVRIGRLIRITPEALTAYVAANTRSAS